MDDKTSPLSEKAEKKVLAWQLGVFITTFILFFPVGLLIDHFFNGSIKYLFLPLTILFFFIGISSIKNRVSILRLRGHKEPSRGNSAVIIGVLLIFLLVVELSVIFIPTLSDHFFNFTGFNPSSNYVQLPKINDTGSTSPIYRIQNNSQFSELNIFTTIFAWGGGMAVPISLDSNNVYFEGDIGSSRGSVNLNLICADVSSGKINWQTLVGSGFIAIDSTKVYAQLPNQPFGGAAGVAAYNISSGSKQWETVFNYKNAIGIDYLAITDNNLSVTTFNHSNTGFNVIDLHTGEVLININNPEPHPLFMIDNGTVYSWSSEHLIATGTSKWKTFIPYQYSLEDFDLAAPVVFDNLIIVKNGHRSYSSITAVRKEDGTIKWQYDQTVVSNIAVGVLVTYFITDTAQLIAVDTQTGKILGSANFTPGFADNFDFINNQIYVAAYNNLIVVHFDDTHQLSIIKFATP